MFTAHTSKAANTRITGGDRLVVEVAGQTDTLSTLATLADWCHGAGVVLEQVTVAGQAWWIGRKAGSVVVRATSLAGGLPL